MEWQIAWQCSCCRRHTGTTSPACAPPTLVADPGISYQRLCLSKIIGKTIFVVTVLGAVQDCYLLHCYQYVTYATVTLGCADCSVVSGIEVGPLIAASLQRIETSEPVIASTTTHRICQIKHLRFGSI